MHSGVAIPLLRRAQFSFSMARRGARHSFASIQTALVALQRNVLLCKMVPTAWGFAFGDCLTQQLGPLWPAEQWPSKHNLAAHDPSKTLAMAGVGACVGAPLSLALYAQMDALMPGAGILLAAGKFTLDQLVGCVVWQAAYMAISEPYRRTFVQFVQDKQQQQQPQAALAVAC